MNLYPFDSTLTYFSFGLTHKATFEIKVQGVVVQTRKYSSESFLLNGTITVSTVISLYPCATSWLARPVPHLGQYGSILCPL